ncbi:MAG: TetR/AcrR family transcriptional regulator [Acidimicrobiales bacterium]
MVKGDSGHAAVRRRQADRRAATRAALMEAARALFAEKGFAGTGREEIVERAGVTRGALYHHFASKADLFRAVYEQVENDLNEAIATAALAATDPMEQLQLGTRAFLDAAAQPDVRRIVLLDAPSVLPPDVRRELMGRYGLGLMREALRAVMDAGEIERQPLEPLAHIVLAGLHEAATLVADGADRDEVEAVVERFLARL